MTDTVRFLRAHVNGIVPISVMLALIVIAVAGSATAEQGAARVRTGIDADRVWATLTDFARWPSIFPSLVSLCAEAPDDSALRLRQKTRSFGVELVHTSRVYVDAVGHRLDLVLDPAYENGLDELTSAWIVTALDDGSSEIELRLLADVAALPIPGFVKSSLLRRSVEESADALAEAAERQRAGSNRPIDPC